MDKRSKLAVLMTAAGCSPSEIEIRVKNANRVDNKKLNEAYAVYVTTQSSFHAQAALASISFTLAPIK